MRMFAHRESLQGLSRTGVVLAATGIVAAVLTSLLVVGAVAATGAKAVGQNPPAWEESSRPHRVRP